MENLVTDTKPYRSINLRTVKMTEENKALKDKEEKEQEKEEGKI